MIIALLVYSSKHPSPQSPDISEWRACDKLGILNVLWAVAMALHSSIALWSYRLGRPVETGCVFFNPSCCDLLRLFQNNLPLCNFLPPMAQPLRHFPIHSGWPLPSVCRATDMVAYIYNSPSDLPSDHMDFAHASRLYCHSYYLCGFRDRLFLSSVCSQFSSG